MAGGEWPAIQTRHRRVGKFAVLGVWMLVSKQASRPTAAELSTADLAATKGFDPESRVFNRRREAPQFRLGRRNPDATDSNFAPARKSAKAHPRCNYDFAADSCVSTATPFFSQPYFHIAGVIVAAVTARKLKYVGVCTASIRAAVCRTSRKYPGGGNIRARHRKRPRNPASFSAIIRPHRPPKPSNKMNASQLDKRFAKHRRTFGDGLNRVYVNGDHTLHAFQEPSGKGEAVTIEPMFRRLMFSGAE